VADASRPGGHIHHVDGRVLEAQEGEFIISAQSGPGSSSRAFATTRGEVGRHVPDVPGRGLRSSGRQPPAGVLRRGGRRPGGLHAVRGGPQGPGRRARVPPPQPPRWTVRSATREANAPPGPVGVPRTGRESIRREKTALGQAHRDRPTCAARSGAVHPMRALHPFCEELAGEPFIDFAGTGDRIEVAIYPVNPSRPTSVATRSRFAGRRAHCDAVPLQVRPWDLEQVETTCTTCAVGCRHGSLSHRRARSSGYLGVDSRPVNQSWQCDRGRFGSRPWRRPGVSASR